MCGGRLGRSVQATRRKTREESLCLGGRSGQQESHNSIGFVLFCFVWIRFVSFPRAPPERSSRCNGIVRYKMIGKHRDSARASSYRLWYELMAGSNLGLGCSGLEYRFAWRVYTNATQYMTQ